MRHRCPPIPTLASITQPDNVNGPQHYTVHPSGIDCIQFTKNMRFNLGNAVKAPWRADLKGNAIEYLRKATSYIERDRQKRGGA